MGATKGTDEDHVRWLSNNEPIDPDHPSWKNDPREDVGQFYSTEGNVSCLITKIFFRSFSGWGIKERIVVPDAKALCEKKIV